jgi:hypothetical protein
MAQLPEHAAWMLCVHAPPASQQEPCGCGHGLVGVHEAPLVQVAVQLPCVVGAHAPVGEQQVPVGCGQKLAEHAPPIVQTPEQLACNTKVHVPESQHVPEGCGHGLGEHALALPW